ncbi:porin [Ancylobacter sp. TS-1]|nr:porin [Ancylobacter sp. TS-1]
MVGTAAAADLPVKAKAAEYVKVCSAYGAGFYYIPGTETCLKVGGYVTADTYYTDLDTNLRVNGFAVASDDPDGQVYFQTRAAIQLDARTQTEYGTLRSYIEARFEYGESFGFDQNDETNEFTFSDNSINDAYLKFGYIQFAGFTIGKATSAFDFWAGDGWLGIEPGNYYSDTTPNLISYTADFGNGFSATISLEDAYAREYSEDNFVLLDGQQVPDIVANIAYEGSWGAFKVSGAYHDNGEYGTLDGFSNPYTVSGDAGWAALAGVRFDIAETTTLYVEGVYADGASGYLGLAGTLPNIDFFGNNVGGWYVGGALIHYWTPTVFTGIVGSYTESDSFAYLPAATASFSGYNVGVNIGWKPVKGLTLALQYDYLNADWDYSNVGEFEDFFTASETAEQNRITFTAKRAF